LRPIPIGSGPSDNEPLTRFSPAHYCEVFKALGATHIVRLNYPEYDPTPFIEVRVVG
jgi:hypothetical protein